MSDRVDRILETIDVGLQQTGEVGFLDDNGRCIRCQWQEPAEGSSWCEDCAVNKELSPDEPLPAHSQARMFVQRLTETIDESLPGPVFEGDNLTIDGERVGDGRFTVLSTPASITGDWVRGARWEFNYVQVGDPVTRHAHFWGGPAHGDVMVVSTDSIALPVFTGAGGWTTVGYNCRRVDLHPASFVSETGGPRAGHWIYDREGTPTPRRVTGEFVVPRELADSPAFLHGVAEIQSRLVLQGARIKDIEWRGYSSPRDFMMNVLGTIRGEAVVDDNRRLT